MYARMRTRMCPLVRRRHLGRGVALQRAAERLGPRGRHRVGDLEHAARLVAFDLGDQRRRDVGRRRPGRRLLGRLLPLLLCPPRGIVCFIIARGCCLGHWLRLHLLHTRRVVLHRDNASLAPSALLLLHGRPARARKVFALASLAIGLALAGRDRVERRLLLLRGPRIVVEPPLRRGMTPRECGARAPPRRALRRGERGALPRDRTARVVVQREVGVRLGALALRRHAAARFTRRRAGKVSRGGRAFPRQPN